MNNTFIVSCRDESFLDIYGGIAAILGYTKNLEVALSKHHHLYRKSIWTNIAIDSDTFIKTVLRDLRRHNCDFVFITELGTKIIHTGLHINTKNLEFKPISN